MYLKLNSVTPAGVSIGNNNLLVVNYPIVITTFIYKTEVVFVFLIAIGQHDY